MSVLALAGRRRAQDDYGYERPQPPPIGHWLLMAAITFIALCFRYWFNFLDSHLNDFNACDASEYLRNAAALVDALKLPTTFWPDSWAVIVGHATPQVVDHLRAQLASLLGLAMSGPIFPIFIAWSYALAAAPFNIADYGAPVLGQSLISGLTCLFIGLTASRVYGKGSGYCAALLAAVYPAFIINSGRLYSETFAAFLLSIVCYITVNNFSEEHRTGAFFGSSLINGFIAACLQFTRSIMFVLTLALLPITFVQQGFRKGIAGLAGVALGFALVALPWLAFQKVALGSASLVVDRVGHYNFFVGNDTDTLGWLSVPYPDGRGIEDKSLAQLAAEAYKRSPSHWWSLMLDKPLRLFEFPWNDFRTPMAKIAVKAQVFWHQVILVLAAIGLTLGFISPGTREGDYGYEDRRKTQRDMTAAKIFLVFAFMLHCAYLFFITVPRYNLTAMVVACVFAGAGIAALVKLLRANNGLISTITVIAASCFVLVISRLPFVNVAATLFGGEHAISGLIVGQILTLLSLLGLSISLMSAVSAYDQQRDGKRAKGTIWARASIIVLALLAAPNFLLHANASGRWYEWRAPIAGGQTIRQSFTLPSDFAQQIEGRQLYLMVDADSAAQLSGATVSVEETKLDGPIIPSLSLTHDFDRYQQTGSGQMREAEWIFRNLTYAAGLTNSDLRQWFIYPIPNELTAGTPGIKVQITSSSDHAVGVYGSYATSPTSVPIPSPNQISWEKAFYGVENDSGLSDCRFNARIKSTAATAYESDLSSEPGVQSGRYNVHLLAGPPAAYSGNVFVINPSMVESFQKLTERPLPLEYLPDSAHRCTITTAGVPTYQPADLWIVRVSGEARRDSGGAKFGVTVRTANDDARKIYVSPWTTTTTLDQQWHHFDISAPLKPGALPAPPEKLSIDFSVGLPSGQPPGTTQFQNVTLQIDRLPANPLQLGNLIY
ncbi:MAG TPA: hypothetical protein V6D22_24420 [Candidatus Obscuribacterales bacterium]